jgi:3-isopropylmalate/(R)-2-methylmalate dehydratase small subunit
MQPFTDLHAKAAPLDMTNLDTDQIIPKQFLKTVDREGLSQGLFYDLRFDAEGKPRPDFVLNDPRYAGAGVLITGDNFGCGSSREHAPWALLDNGIRCVIAPSFADIFYNNCFKNGILPIKLPKEVCDELMEDAKKGANAVMTIDLEAQTISRPDGEKVHFELDAFRKHCLVNGLDDIGLSEAKDKEIGAYEETARRQRPWQSGTIQRGA